MNNNRMLRDKNGFTEDEFLARYRPEKYPRPFVTADNLIFSLYNGELKILMVKRKGHPYLGDWAFPGGFAQPGETVDTTAERELFEETHLEDLPLRQLGTFSDPNRDPRGWVITQAYLSIIDGKPLPTIADDDAEDAKWFSIHCEQLENNYFLTLEADDITLFAELQARYQPTALGDQLKIRLFRSDGFAFDHAKILLYGLLHLPKGWCKYEG